MGVSSEIYFAFELKLASYHITLSLEVPFCVGATIPILRMQINKISNHLWLSLPYNTAHCGASLKSVLQLPPPYLIWEANQLQLS